MSVPRAVATGSQRAERLKIEETTRSLPLPVLTSSRPMITFTNIKRMLRGEISVGTAALEVLRRMRATLDRRRERAGLAGLDPGPARLRENVARLSPADSRDKFCSRH